MKERAWIELNMDHLKQNVHAFQSMLQKKCRIMAVVKADAYGHGAVEVAKYLETIGVTDFCVASVAEGIELRNAGVIGEILILGYTHPARLEEVVAYDLMQTVIDADYANNLKEFGKEIRVHVGIDTGMHRLGERFENIEEIIKIWEIKNLKIEGIFSHLCVADSMEKEDIAFTKLQIERFNQIRDKLIENGIKDFCMHIQSSYGVLNYPECEYDFVRLGVSLYGSLSAGEDKVKADIMLNPVLSLKSRIECVKELVVGESAGYGLDFTAKRNSKIAAVAIGYADGIPRNISKEAYVLCQGKRAPIVGRLCMDQILIDVTDIKEVAPHTEITVIGEEGAERITAEMFAGWAGTITNEIFSRLGKRLKIKS